MRSIGEMARDSGLTASALRFYDRSGVLVPVHVDPLSSYRWYGPEQLDEARLLARLRRAGMPLSDIRLALAGWAGGDAGLVRGLLEEHLRRLERGLSDARREFSTVRTLIEDREKPVTVTTTAQVSVSATELLGALDAVRFAAGGADPALPMLAGVLFDVEGDGMRVVATDRYRLAVARAATAGHGGGRVQIVVPSALVDAMRALLGGAGDARAADGAVSAGGASRADGSAAARLTVDGDRITLEAGGGQAGGRGLGRGFPDYRRLVRLPAGRRVEVDTAALRAAVADGPVRAGEVREQDGVAFDRTVLAVTADGGVAVSEDGDHHADRVGVNRDFLLQALAAGARDRLVLELGGPTTPLAIRRPDAEGTFSLLMPVRLEA
ncbi:MerR family transcriptional regulator [Streptomyces sp. NPDC059176]|uniref:DNA polymerase III subunit beta family protein n=1 Tax=unclassified Streptomyces TaxID=2593676 RepID=UPI0036852F8F